MNKLPSYIALEAILSVFLIFLLSATFYTQAVSLRKDLNHLSQRLEFYRYAKESREILLAKGESQMSYKGVNTIIEYAKDRKVVAFLSTRGHERLETRLR